MFERVIFPLRKLHGYIYECKLAKKKIKELKHEYKQLLDNHFKNNPRSVVLVLTPIHSNLGDHAIAFAEAQMLKSLGISYIEFTGQVLEKLQGSDILDVMNGYPILINGGGNMGTLWFDVETLMRDVIKSNPKSPIAILPNTIYYENSTWGITELENSRKIFNKHKKLRIYARENKSYNFMKSNYKDVKLVPDVVLSLNKSEPPIDRSGCLLLLRNDCEKTRTSSDEKELLAQIDSLFGTNYVFADTHANGDVPIEHRVEQLNKKFNQVKSAELVITDRLHGMIFSAITGTPCIVIDSKSPKLKSSYEWIKDLEYVQFAESVSQIRDIYTSIPKGMHMYNNDHLKPYFDILIQDICDISEGK